MVDNLLDLTKEYEGLRLEAYDDATGRPVPEGGVIRGTLTIGWGHTGDDVYVGQVISEAQAEALLRRDLANAARDAVAVIGLSTWRRLDPVRQACLIDMCFNLGAARLAGFVRMIAAIRRFDWQAAHDECLASAWRKQVHRRCDNAAGMLLTGRWPVFAAAVSTAG